eukprot:CAMPEP_0201567182 /NCGR_PEP_ID=MMETSP0190_2-20130828/7552_1 /ASSEMBLY_ACC=CAM_ASM_000263 /TAXON_ID=37353 /ORGANISM="Rosalina sp." /LENGTH=304 /DNA_ID=CAMNT_0047986869 /DNA_START=63 /DNA_END=974 /DNA_ORIENTATION=-
MYSIALCLALIGIVYGAYECTESNTWVNLPNVPTQTGEVSQAVIGDFLYVAGEENVDTYKYDLKENKWSTIAKRSYPGNHQNAFVYNEEWWLVGGIDENSYGKVQVYTPSSDKWRTEADMPWDGGSVCVELINDATIIACGGIQGFQSNNGGTNTTNKCAKYDIKSGANKWEMMGNMPYRRNHAGTSVDSNGLMWIFGGREGRNVVSDGYPTVQTYNLTSNKWKTSNDSDHPYETMPIGRGGIGNAIYNDGKFYIFGGETKDNPGGKAVNGVNVYNRTDIYNIAENKWTQGKDMPYPRHGIFPV